MWRLSLRICALGLSGLFLLGATCQQSGPLMLNGKKVKPKLGEYQLIQAARSAKKTGEAAKEADQWKQLLEKFPGSAFKSEALLRLGILAHKRGKHSDAVSHLEKAFASPLNPNERAGAYQAYGGSLYALGRYPEALKALEHAYPGLGEADKKKALPLLVRSALKARDLRAEIRWMSEQLPFLPASQREVTRKRLMSKVDGSLSLQELQLLFVHRGSGLRFPFDYIGFRLTRAYCHSAQYEACDQTLKLLLQNIPESHPLRADITAFHKRRASLSREIDPMRIGLILPKSGRGKVLGRWIQSAIELARRDYPNKGIQLIVRDSGSIPSLAVKAVDELVLQKKVAAIFGPILSKTAVAAAHRAQALGVPLLTIAVPEDLPYIGSYIFRNNLTLSQMGQALANFSFKRLGHTRFAVFYPNSPFGRIQVGAFWKEIERLGGKVVSAEYYAPTAVNFAELARRLTGRELLKMRPGWYKRLRLAKMSQIKSYTQRRRLYKKLKKSFPPVLDFDAVFVPETFGQLRKIVLSLVQQDIEFKRHYKFWEDQTIEKYKQRKMPLKFIQLLGSNSMQDPRILRLPRVDLQQYVGSLFCVRYFPDSKRQIVRRFVNNFTASFSGRFPMLKKGIPPLHFSAYAYDSMRLLFHIALAKKPKTRKAFRDALLGARQISGVTGPLTVHSSGNVLAPIRIVLIHRKGDFRLFHEIKKLLP